MPTLTEKLKQVAQPPFKGYAVSPDAYLTRKMNQFSPWFSGENAELRSQCAAVRRMSADPRVRRIHEQHAQDICKGGLLLEIPSRQKKILREWDSFSRSLRLFDVEKLASHSRKYQMEGNLHLQVVVDENAPGRGIVSAVAMPSDTLVPLANENGQFTDQANAWEQWDWTQGQRVASFAHWQLPTRRLSPENHDDMGSRGIPLMYHMRKVLAKLDLLEDSLVKRRYSRGPERRVHILEGASEEELTAYKEAVEQNYRDGQAGEDFFLNRKGAVSSLGSDAKLSEIDDIIYLRELLFPAASAVYGYETSLARDVLEEVRKGYYMLLDYLQDGQSQVYEDAFRVHLLLKGINPDSYDFAVRFAERNTLTLQQRSDYALKLQALGASKETTWRAAGLDPSFEIAQLQAEAADADAYPVPQVISQPKVSITPGNGPQGESETYIGNA